MGSNFVKLYGEIIHLKENKLFLNNFGIEDISEIEGLEKKSPYQPGMVWRKELKKRRKKRS